ncbi:hypothetical protein [Sulfurimonas sp.]
MKKFEDKNYILVEEHDRYYFEEVVERSIDLGFEPIGGISVYVRKEDGLLVYCQALVRRRKKQCLILNPTVLLLVS